MVNQQTLQGHWNEIRGRLRTRWGNLTNDDLASFDGNVEELVGLIQRKTGEARSVIEGYLDELTSSGASFFNHAAEEVRGYVHQAADRVQERSRQAAESMQQGYETVQEGISEAEEMVRRRPAESAIICFGAGVLAGVLLGLFVRRT